MPAGGLAPQQCSFEQEPAFRAVRRNGFVSRRLIAPDERVTFLHHSSEKILILTTCAELVPEDFHDSIQDSSLDQDIAGAGLLPTDRKSGVMRSPFVEPGLRHPFRRRDIEIRLHRRKHAFHAIRFYWFFKYYHHPHFWAAI